MSINWVMLDNARNFIPLPREKTYFTSPPRTALALDAGNAYPGKEPLAVNCSSGIAHLTNQRLIYLPSEPTPKFQSFSAPILNLQDTHVSAPFFGPNIWYGVLQPVTGGGIPAHHAYVKLKMTFKEGGAFDFSSTYERLKESLAQAAETARESGRTLDLSETDLEQLPAYEEVGGGAGGGGGGVTASSGPPPPIQRPVPISPTRATRPSPIDNDVIPSSNNAKSTTNGSSSNHYPPPDGPPPGYEETQQNTIANNLEESVRRSD